MKNNDYRRIAQKLPSVHPPYRITVSVVLPVYNCAALLAKTLAALRRQTYPASLMEVVVADDGSTDDLARLLTGFRSSPRDSFGLNSVHQEHSGFRLASIRNKAIRAAHGDLIVALDGDMAPLPGCIEDHLRWFHLQEPVATIGSRRFVDLTGIDAESIERDARALEGLADIESASNVYPRERRLRELQHFFAHPAPWTLFHGCNVAYLRSDALACGLYDEEFDGNYGYEDIEFGYRLFSSGVYLVDEPDACALHQENDGLTRDERVRQSAVNYEIALRKIPELSEFRARFAAANYVPWWHNSGPPYSA